MYHLESYLGHRQRHRYVHTQPHRASSVWIQFKLLHFSMRCRSNHFFVPQVTGVGYHDGNRGFRLRTAGDSRRQDGSMTSAAIQRIWSDFWIHWCENTWAGAERLQPCAAQHVVQHKGRTRTERR